MRPYKRHNEDDGDPGAPEWMVTFSDCMTLLLTFFVLLLTFSTFDEHVLRKLRVIFCKAMPAVSKQKRENKDALLAPKNYIIPIEDPYEGSEKETLAKGKADNFKRDKGPLDFRRRKVFVIPSKELFWANGSSISLQGRKSLSVMASFLKEVPGRVIISENIASDNTDEQLGLSRAWGVMQHLATKHGLDKKRFSISATSTIAQESSSTAETNIVRAKAERSVEIVLLERSIYN